jgi:hypothetical protein
MARGSQINLFGVGVGEVGKSLNVTASSRVNLYYDIQPAPGDKSQIAVFGTPGLYPVLTLPISNWAPEGMLANDRGYINVVQKNKFLVIGYTSAPAILTEKTLTADAETVVMTSGGDNVAIAARNYFYSYSHGTGTFAKIQFDGTAQDITGRSVTFQDGYFILNQMDDGAKFYISALYDPTTFSPLDYGVAEFSGDSLSRVLSQNGLLYLFGFKSYEVWQNVGDVNFPFQRINGATQYHGLYAFESIAEVGNAVVGLFVNRQNDLAFMRVAGYEATNITPPDLAYRLNHATAAHGACAFSWSVGGHDFYQVSFDDETWLYDALSGSWSILKSGSGDRHIAQRGARYGQFADDGAPILQTIVCSYNDGRLFAFDDSLYTDDGVTNTRELIGNHIFMPDRGTFTMRSIAIDMEHGVDTNPLTVYLSLSRDGGHTFGEEYSDTSTSGQFTRFFQFNRLGKGRDIVPKIRTEDPCKFVLIGAVADIAPYGW